MRRRGWSAGTIAMMIFTAVVLCCTAWAILNIRGGKENLTMDAERLSGSVGALVASLQSTEAPAVTAMAFTQAPAVMDETAPMITAPPMTAQPAATQAPGVRRTLTLTVGGAFVPTTRIYNGAMKGGEYRPGLPFGGIADVLHADINIAMLDVSAISGDNAWWAQAMKSAGFDCVVPLRENARDSARVDVLHTLSANGMTGLGASETQETFTLHTVNGIRMAAMAYAEDASQAGGWIPAFDGELLRQNVQAARAQGAQVVSVFLHWKKGTASEPTAAQRVIAQAAADAGADLLIGIRVGMVLPVEYVVSQITGRSMVTAWSMGTLLSENRDDRAAVSGMLLHIAISCDSNGVEISRPEYTPCYCWGQQEEGVFRCRVLQSALPAPADMIDRQKEIMARALKLIQDTMNQGIATQR